MTGSNINKVSSMKPKHLDAFMDTAYRFAELSTAVRAQVGAIIVKDRRIISIGYNGMPSGWDNCCEDREYMDLDPGGCLDQADIEHLWPHEDKQGRYQLRTKPQVLHAEANAIAKLAQSPESAKDAVLFCTHMPCMECAKLIHQSGIRTVYYGEKYNAAKGSGEEFLCASGISLNWLPKKPSSTPVTVEKIVECTVEKIIEVEHPKLFAYGKLLPPDYVYTLGHRSDGQGDIFTASIFKKTAFLTCTARYDWGNLYKDIVAVHNLFDIEDWVIDYSYEAHIMQAFDHTKGTLFSAVHNTILQINEEFGINFDQFHLIHGNYFIKNVYNSWLKANNIQQTIAGVENLPILFMHRYYINAIKHYKPSEFNKNLAKQSQRHYCTFNGRAGYDRVELLKFLHRDCLLEQGYSTWHFDEESWEIIHSEQPDIQRINRLPAGDLTPNHFNAVTVEWGKRKEQELVDAYKTSAFEIVVETITHIEQESFNWDCVDEGRPKIDWILDQVPGANTVFFTEKIARPLFWGVPFFLHAGHHSLAALRELGFKTFSELWDENYDLIEDPAQRANALYASIKTVLAMPLAELDQLCAQHQSIMKHNQKRFKELASLRPTKLWMEMRNAQMSGHTNRTVFSQLAEPNQHIRLKHGFIK